ncbi:MAG: hypothetical protein HAW67_04940 [Endozoicomonadaceae bacterium]|nr:hypothetical protein [Endozoicomonadaceae bacterium]
MSKFTLVREQSFGDVQAKLYSYTEKESDLNAYIQKQIKRPQQKFNDILDQYGQDSLDTAALLEQYEKLSTPHNHAIPAFDVKRSTVTEFMAEYLLAKEFQCIFFEESNKKINKSVVDANRHSTGVDVVGIQENENTLKFVVAEVKASQDPNIPCAPAESLKKDIINLLDFENDRLYREIFAMIDNFKKPEIEKYITFLVDLINKQDAPKQFIERIIIYPFLIRNNVEIVKKKKLDDYKNFSQLDTKGVETIGIVWALNKDLDAFVNSIYSND